MWFIYERRVCIWHVYFVNVFALVSTCEILNLYTQRVPGRAIGTASAKYWIIQETMPTQ